MIRSYFGIARNPFASTDIELLPHQQTIFDTLKVHCQQGGLCLVLGEPGTGKTVLKESLKNFDAKRLITPTVSRTLHTYFNTIKILSSAFGIEFEGCCVFREYPDTDSGMISDSCCGTCRTVILG